MNNLNTLPTDLLIELALYLDLSEIVSWCRLNKRFNKVTCENEIFWMNKFFHDFGHYPKVSNKSWKEFYRHVTVTVTNPYDLLTEGSKNGILSYVVIALIRGANIHSYNDGALRYAATYGQLEVVKYLVENGADIHAENDEALKLAAEYGHLEVVKYLVENGADIHSYNDESLTFRFAARYGHLEIVKYLVKNGSDIHAQNDQALKMATSDRRLKVVKYLVKNGADIYSSDDYSFLSAVVNGYLEIVKYLKSLL